MQHYPLDIDSLKKGDVISPEQLAYIFGEKIDSDAYKLQALALVTTIEAQRRTIGAPVTAQFLAQYGIKILMDSDAAVITRKRTSRHLRGITKDHRNRVEIDVENLDQEEREKLDKDIIYGSKLLLALKGVRKSCRLTSTPRQTPSITAE